MSPPVKIGEGPSDSAIANSVNDTTAAAASDKQQQQQQAKSDDTTEPTALLNTMAIRNSIVVTREKKQQQAPASSNSGGNGKPLSALRSRANSSNEGDDMPKLKSRDSFQINQSNLLLQQATSHSSVLLALNHSSSPSSSPSASLALASGGRSKNPSQENVSNGSQPSGTNSPSMSHTKSAIQINKEIEKYLAQEKKLWTASQKEPKLLLLGPADSGKSTVLKQMKILHGEGFTVSERNTVRLGIRRGIMTTCKVLLDYMASCGDPFDSASDKDDESFLKHWKVAADFWSLESTKNTYKHLPQNSLPDTASYYMGLIHNVKDPNYLPSDEQILMLRTCTESISKTTFKIKEKNFHFFDVSGLKHHRNYWIPYFEDVTSVLFIASLSSFDQVMMEDGVTNRLVDTLALFDHTCNHKLLSSANCILFLNKKDLFEKKIKEISLKTYFEDYADKDHSISRGIHFIDQKFKKRITGKKQVFSHVTQATDTQAMKFIVAGVVSKIIEDMLRNVYNVAPPSEGGGVLN